MPDAMVSLRAEVEAAPSLLSRTANGVLSAGVSTLTFAGKVLTVYGAHTIASRNSNDFRGNMPVEAAVYTTSFVFGMASGILDDGFAAATVEMGSAPVLDSWERNGAGPVQVAVGNALREYNRWVATF